MFASAVNWGILTYESMSTHSLSEPPQVATEGTAVSSTFNRSAMIFTCDKLRMMQRNFFQINTIGASTQNLRHV